MVSEKDNIGVEKDNVDEEVDNGATAVNDDGEAANNKNKIADEEEDYEDVDEEDLVHNDEEEESEEKMEGNEESNYATTKRRELDKLARYFYPEIVHQRQELREYSLYQQSLLQFKECRDKYFPQWGIAPRSKRGKNINYPSNEKKHAWLDSF